jgi:hypothetical protein
MSNSSVILPVLIQLSLTLLMFLLLGVRKTRAIKAGNVDRTKTALDNKAWPEDVVKVSNNIANQFQTPVLFYMLCILFYVTNTVSTLVIVLAWIYVISRLIHAYVHITSNYVPARFKIFIVSVLTLIVMTIVAFLNIPMM